MHANMAGKSSIREDEGQRRRERERLRGQSVVIGNGRGKKESPRGIVTEDGLRHQIDSNVTLL